MDNTKNDEYYLQKIISDLEFIVFHMKNINSDDFCSNDILIDSMMFRMIQISENSKKLSDEYKTENCTLPWNAISGLRNRIVHDYGHIDYNIVFDTLKNDIPVLLSIISNR